MKKRKQRDETDWARTGATVAFSGAKPADLRKLRRRVDSGEFRTMSHGLCVALSRLVNQQERP